MTERVQLSRRKGWRMPPDTVKVDRSTRWGNPFVVSKAGAGGKDRARAIVAKRLIGVSTVEDAIECYRVWVTAPGFIAAARAELRGKNLACWCKPGAPCHADVLLELAGGTP